MERLAYLKVILKLMALYAGVMGALALLFQDVAYYIFRYPLTDVMIARYWGAMLLVMAVFYLFLSYDPIKYRIFIWIGVFDLGFATCLTIINIATGVINWTQGAVAIVLNPIFVVILLYGLAKEPEGEVIFVAGEEKKGKPEHELPPHITGNHPLHRK